MYCLFIGERSAELGFCTTKQFQHEQSTIFSFFVVFYIPTRVCVISNRILRKDEIGLKRPGVNRCAFEFRISQCAFRLFKTLHQLHSHCMMVKAKAQHKWHEGYKEIWN